MGDARICIAGGGVGLRTTEEALDGVRTGVIPPPPPNAEIVEAVEAVEPLRTIEFGPALLTAGTGTYDVLC